MESSSGTVSTPSLSQIPMETDPIGFTLDTFKESLQRASIDWENFIAFDKDLRLEIYGNNNLNGLQKGMIESAVANSSKSTQQEDWRTVIRNLIPNTAWNINDPSVSLQRLLSINLTELCFTDALDAAILKILTHFRNSTAIMCAMISGLRRSGKSTLLKYFCIKSMDAIRDKKIFVFHLDFNLFTDGTFLDMLSKFLTVLFKQLGIHVSNYDANIGENIRIRLSTILGHPTEDTIKSHYSALFELAYKIVSYFGFKEILFLIDEFERSFPKIISGSGSHFKTSFNEMLKTEINTDSPAFQRHFLLAGTDALQMAVAGLNGVSSGNSILHRGVKNNIITTTGLVSYERFEREFLHSEMFEWPLLEGETTNFDDYGGIAAYLSYFIKSDNPLLALSKLKVEILNQLDQDFRNIVDNIIYFKSTLYKSLDKDSLLGQLKTDILCLLRGLEPRHLDLGSSYGLIEFLDTIKIKVPIYAMIMSRSLTGRGFKLTTRVNLEMETNPSVLGWSIQDAVAENLQLLRGNHISAKYLNADLQLNSAELIKFDECHTLDFSTLSSIISLENNIFYYDPGKATEDRAKQIHLPGIDAICGGTSLKKKISVDSYQIKSTIHLEASSVNNTIAKFVVKRTGLDDSVLSRFLKLCYRANEPNVFLNLIEPDSREKGDFNVDNADIEELTNLLNTFIFDGITFSWKNSDGKEVAGKVNLYILVFGSMSHTLVDSYPGVRFVWGPTQLTVFIGYEMMKSLLGNDRFRLISILTDKVGEQLAHLDKTYEICTLKQKEEQIKLYTLKNTPIQLIQRYLAYSKSLQSIESVLINDQEMTVSFKTETKKRKHEETPKPVQKKKSRYDDADYILPYERRGLAEAIKKSLSEY